MIREPVKRCISRFYYERDARGIIKKNATIDDCLSNKVSVTKRGSTCNFEAWRPQESVASAIGWSRWAQLREECASNYLTRWFCGHDESCSPKAGAGLSSISKKKVTQRQDSHRMLQTAMINLEQAHAAVGLVERMSDSLRLFQYTVPSFFGGVADSLLNTVCNKCNPNRTYITNPPPSTQHANLLARINVLDLALYDFASQVFSAKFSICFSTAS